MSLEDILNKPKPQEPPKGWKPYKEVGSNGLSLTTGAYPVGEISESDELQPNDVQKLLKNEGLDPKSWEVTSWSKSVWGQTEGYKLAAKPTFTKFGVSLPPLESIVSGMKASKKTKNFKHTSEDITVVALLADAQVGKVDVNGGTEDLLERCDEALNRWIDYVKTIQPTEIILADLGDGIEGFENVAAQSQTNDIGLADQIALFGHIRMKWLCAAAQLAPRVYDVSMPSNHTAIRSKKDVLGAPDNDYGLLVQQFLKMTAEMMPEKFGHVSFHAPSKYEESLTIHAAGGHRLGFVHGHQVSQPHAIDDWWYKQIAGGGPLEFAQTLNYGHFHHLFIREGRNGKKIIGAPSVDNGSSWINNLQGVSSKAGVLTYTVSPTGPFDFVVC